jgi:Tol biopolymer transport system component
VAEPIPVILYGSQSEFRETRAVSTLLGEETGGLTEFYKRRVVVPSTGSLAELEHVLTHELAHAFQLDILRRARPGGPTEAISWTPPLWVMEGLSEYLSVPGLDAHTEMWLRDAVYSGELTDLESLERVADIRVYRYGQSAVAHLAARFGDGSLGPWLRAMARRRDVAAAPSEVCGMSLERLSEDWHEALRRRYLPDLARAADLGAVARRLTDHRRSLAGFHAAPAVSRDGLQMVYVADETPYADLYLASALDGRHRRRLIRGERRDTFESLRYARTSIEWSPDDRLLALVATSGGRDRLVLFDVRRREVARSFDFGLDEMLSPTFAPDGRELIFVGVSRGGSNLYRVTAKGDSLRPLLAGDWGVFQPAWSPDGSRVAFVTDGGRSSFWDDTLRASWQIALLDLRDGSVERIAGEGKNLNPQWLPDGRRLAYLSDRSGVSNLYVHDLERGTDEAVTDLRTGISGLAPTGAALSVARGGARAVVSVFADQGWDLFAIEDPGALRAVALPPAAAPRGSDSLTAGGAPPDSAAEVPDVDLWQVMRETAALPESLSCRATPYRPRLTLDVVQAGGLYATGYGAVAAAQFVFSDMLGDRQLLLGADVSGSLADGNYLLGFVGQRHRWAWSAAAYQYVLGYGLGTAPGYPEAYQKRRIRGLELGYSYPLSHFRRIEVLVDGVWEQRYQWSCTEGPYENLWTCGWGAREQDLLYASPCVAWVHDSALFGPTGPLSGQRARISGGVDVGERRARTLEVDLRAYVNLRKRYALAWRGVLVGEWGRDAEPLAFGGPYSLHGYADRPLVGTKIAFTNLEFRFPFVDDLLIAWPVRLRFYGIRGALFFDLGGAWDEAADFQPFRSGSAAGAFRLEDLRAACGVRAAINLGFTVLRYELSRRTDLAEWQGRAESEVSLGWEF